MTGLRDVQRLGLLGRSLPPSFAMRAMVITPGTDRPFDEHTWRDAIVEVEQGQLELELRDGQRLLFDAGEVLWLTGLPALALHNPGDEDTVLVAISRRDIDHASP
ncbi:MAG: cupin domain-containing protein [Actinomycetota bacterium]|nr:cupin domain-containing protein [Actinomycetota bacterium]